MPIELECKVCGGNFLVPPSRSDRLTCSKRCIDELKRLKGYSPALKAAVAKRRETDGDPEVRKRRYGHRRGSIRSDEERERTSESLRSFYRERGIKPIGSTDVDANGYVLVLCASDPSDRRSRKRKTDGAVSRYLHDVIVEGILGRPLKSNEVVHHRDENRRNNDPTNLRLMKKRAHDSLHARLRSIRHRTPPRA